MRKKGKPESKATRAMRRRWRDPAFRSRMEALVRSDEMRVKLREAAIARWKDPEFRKRQMELRETPEHKAKCAAKQFKKNNADGVHSKGLAAMRALQQQDMCPPEHRNTYNKLRRNGIGREEALRLVREIKT